MGHSVPALFAPTLDKQTAQNGLYCRYMNTTHETIQQYVDRLGITAEAKLVDSNPHMEEDEWSRSATHYFVTLDRKVNGQNRKMDVHFSQGSAITEEPDAVTVLDSLASDVSSVDQESDWITWARDLGYTDIADADKARSIYKAIQKQREQLVWLLEDDELEKLLYETERL